MQKDFTVPENMITAASFKTSSIQSPNAWIGHLPFASWIIQQVKPNIFVELGALESIIESAKRGQKRSWIKLAFNRWRPLLLS